MKLRWKWLRRGAAIGGAVMSGVIALLALTGTWHRPAGWALCEGGVEAREINWLDTTQDFLICADQHMPRSFVGSYGRTSLVSSPAPDPSRSHVPTVGPEPSTSYTSTEPLISRPETGNANQSNHDITTTAPPAFNDVVSAVLARAGCEPGTGCEEPAAREEPDSLLACLHVAALNDDRPLVLVVTRRAEPPPSPDHSSVIARSELFQGIGSSNCHQVWAINERLKDGEYWLWTFAGSTVLTWSRFLLNR